MQKCREKANMDKIKIEYEEGKQLVLKNVICCRRKVEQAKASDILVLIEEYIKNNDLKKMGPYINVTHGIETENDKIIMDIEILTSVDRLKNTEERENGIRKIKELVINNALVCKMECSPLRLVEVNGEIENYIEKMKLDPVTPGYLVTKKKDTANNMMLNEMEYELYIGMSCDETNIL